jgi:hypothetical protein
VAKNKDKIDLSMLPLTSRIKLAVVVAGMALDEGNFRTVAQWLRLGARVADEIDDICYEVQQERNNKEDDIEHSE